MDRPTVLFDKALILRHIPLFADLNPFERHCVYDALEILEYKTDEVIYHEGDSPDAFYCMITGRVEIYVERQGRQEALEVVHRGKYFGFISLLTGEPHSVSARALNDTVVARISKEKFSAILKRIPRLAIDLSQMLSRRLKRKDFHEKTIFESTIVSVFGDQRVGWDTAIYALNLALGLRRETAKKVILVDCEKGDSTIGRVMGSATSAGFVVDEPLFDASKLSEKIVHTRDGVDVLVLKGPERGHWNPAALISLLTLLVNDYHYCLVHLPHDFGPEVFKILLQSDIIHLVATAELEAVKRMSRLLEMAGFSREKAVKRKIRLLVVEEKEVHGKGRMLSVCQEESLLHLPVYATLPSQDSRNPFLVSGDPSQAYAKVIRRIARQMGEVLTGLALGCGSAMGLSHIGVLQVLEEEGIPVDMVSGSSIGALIGALWVAGFSAGEIQTIILKNNKKRYLFGPDDLVFPLRGLIRGRHIKSFLKKYLGEKTFCDLKKPFRAVACDCRTMRQEIFESGKLVDAVMASIAIPGVLSPYEIAGRYYIDGGIVNPLPTDVLVEAGAKKIIAVNVLPSPEEIERTFEVLRARRIKPDFEKQGVWRYPLYFFKNRFDRWLDPNIFGIIVSTMQSMEYLLAQVSGLSQSDVYLHPDMSGVSWSDFSNLDDLIDRGRREVRDHLQQIRLLATHED